MDNMSDGHSNVGVNNTILSGDYSQFQAALNKHQQHTSNDGRHGSNYSWNGVMDFLKDQERKAQKRE